MTSYPIDDTQRRYARLAGLMYFGNYITAVAGVVGMSTIKGSGDFADRSTRLLASEPLYRAALTSMAISWVILALQAYMLYVTLKPVNKHVAQIALILEGSQAVIGAVSVMFGFAIMRLYTSAQTSGPLPPDQLQLLVRVVNAAYDGGFNIAMLFFAPASLLFFYLFYKSGYLPRALAGLGVFGSAMMVLSTVGTLIRPDGVLLLTYAAWIPMGIAEVTTAFWLTFKGIRSAPPPVGELATAR